MMEKRLEAPRKEPMKVLRRELRRVWALGWSGRWTVVRKEPMKVSRHRLMPHLALPPEKAMRR